MYIRGSKIKGKLYYSIVECKRIRGKVVQRIVVYLGTAENLLKMLKKRGRL